MLQLVLKKTRLKPATQSIFGTFFTLVFVLQVSGCFWKIGAAFNLDSSKNWLRTQELIDEPVFTVYIASVYWSVVTCTTVGYGDILPTNGYELFWGMIIIVVGVAVFSFILGDLSSQFSELSSNSSAHSDRVE